ncbi:B3 domain-containing transcription factor VRN1 [Trifolium repens]|nr:B3 domain-containing transcription factor VRN1 [Trifolium repens]
MEEFVEYYSIGYGCYLSFKYEGNSKFSVIIFDATSVEICYPFKTPSTNEEANTKYDSPRKRSKVETNESCGKKAKSMSKDASKSAKDAANEFNPNNPYFRIKITMRKHAYVPSDFARKYLKPNVPIKLQNSYGEQWEVYCISHGARWYNMEISKGFFIFLRDSNLSHGDYCVFELIKKKPVVLKVTMFRAAEICYPFKTPSTNEEPNTKYQNPRKRSKVETSESRGKKVKSMSKDALKSAKDAANECNPNNPYFRLKITMRKHGYVPCDFARKYLKPNVPIKLQNSYGEHWEVYCIFLHGMEISKGFSKFQRDNNLSHGDYCVFELIKKKPVVLKVTMFRTIDYRD